MPAEYTYDYAIIRLVPRVERGERINAGVILSCPDAEFLEARVELDVAALLALDPAADVEVFRTALALFPLVCRGGPDSGPIGGLPPRARFRWLVSPRSTVVQVSAVHTGRTGDPSASLSHLMDTVVRRRPVAPRAEA